MHSRKIVILTLGGEKVTHTRKGDWAVRHSRAHELISSGYEHTMRVAEAQLGGMGGFHFGEGEEMGCLVPEGQESWGFPETGSRSADWLDYDE